MKFSLIQAELLTHLRGSRTKNQLAHQLGFDSNKIYRLEQGKTALDWGDFLKLCRVSKKDPQKLLKESFSYFGKPDDHGALVRHFIGKRKQEEIAQEMGVSRSMISRWMTGSNCPNFLQMMNLIYTCSMDFFKFFEWLTGPVLLPSLADDFQKEQAHIQLYDKFPWLSVLLSAIDLSGYRKDPTTKFLQEKTRLTTRQINKAIEALQAQDLLNWNGRYWETKIRRVRIRGSLEVRRKTHSFILNRTLDGLPVALGHPEVRFSWKTFSINPANFEKIMQKYSEFFNEVGQLIDKGQEDADKVYFLYMALMDFDRLPLVKEES